MPSFWIGLALLGVLVTGCGPYDLPPLSAMKGQTAARQAADAKECASQVQTAARVIGAGLITGWSEEERYTYLACMEGRGYAVTR